MRKHLIAIFLLLPFFVGAQKFDFQVHCLSEFTSIASQSGSLVEDPSSLYSSELRAPNFFFGFGLHYHLDSNLFIRSGINYSRRNTVYRIGRQVGNPPSFVNYTERNYSSKMLEGGVGFRTNISVFKLYIFGGGYLGFEKGISVDGNVLPFGFEYDREYYILTPQYANRKNTAYNSIYGVTGGIMAAMKAFPYLGFQVQYSQDIKPEFFPFTLDDINYPGQPIIGRYKYLQLGFVFFVSESWRVKGKPEDADLLLEE